MTLIEVRTQVGYLSEARDQTSSLVIERLTTLTARVIRLEDQVERLRYGPGAQGNERK